ncbi:Succinate-semialdehyde dehydrogenase [Fusarium keratoplasticum]|nr:Succinate-semialdehyde dehydrogenase [Fusarium keratoplasticum]
MHSIPPLKDPSLLIGRAFINGETTSALSGEIFDVHDPATGTLVGTCPDMGSEDVLRAIAVTDSAFLTFRRFTGRERATLLRNWYQLVIDNLDDLATIITWENGKPLNDVKSEVTYAANFLAWFSEEAPRIYGNTISTSTASNRVSIWKEPIGVCGLITPWNFPAAMTARKMVPAIAAGCTVVAKSPGESPFTSNALAELSRRAGIPKGVINIVSSLQHTVEVGKVLTTDPRIKKTSFTGSTAVGKILMQQAASTLKRVSFELGGNAPFIVFDDCDIEAAVVGAVMCKFRSSGKTCVCANRIYVQRGFYDQFATQFTNKVRQLKVGAGFNNVNQGPLIHNRAVSKVHRHVRDAQEKGARVLVGGERIASLGPNFYAITVLSGVTKDMQITQEETFGPVAGLSIFDTEKEVLALSNDTYVGLAGYFYSNDISRIYRVAEALQIGMIGVNAGIISDVVAPFGGVK